MTSYRVDQPNPNRHRRCRWSVEAQQEGPGLMRYQVVEKYSGRIVKDNFVNREHAWNWLIRLMDGEHVP
ncbi:MAG: hypothetical protein WAK55_20930 [Xanthobacteraceae bacterium]